MVLYPWNDLRTLHLQVFSAKDSVPPALGLQWWRRKASRTGQREELGCEALTTQAPVGPLEHSGTAVAL